MYSLSIVNSPDFSLDTDSKTAQIFSKGSKFLFVELLTKSLTTQDGKPFLPLSLLSVDFSNSPQRLPLADIFNVTCLCCLWPSSAALYRQTVIYVSVINPPSHCALLQSGLLNLPTFAVFRRAANHALFQIDGRAEPAEQSAEPQPRLRLSLGRLLPVGFVGLRWRVPEKATDQSHTNRKQVWLYFKLFIYLFTVLVGIRKSFR